MNLRLDPRWPLWNTMLENDLQNNVLHEAALTGWTGYHTHDSRRSQEGFPDLVLINTIYWHILWIELKKQTGSRLEPVQVGWRDLLLDLHEDWRLWRPSDWDEIVRTLRGEDLRGLRPALVLTGENRRVILPGEERPKIGYPSGFRR